MRHTFLPLGLACLLGLCALPATVEAADLSQAPASIDINQRLQDWKDYGGARLYWLSVAQPRQIRMGGAPFVDPASHPLLNAPDKTPPRRSKRRAPRKTQAAPTAQTPAAQTPGKAAVPPAPSAPAKPVASGQGLGAGSVPIEQGARRPRGGRVEVTTEVPRPVAPVSGGPWAPVPGTPPVAGLGLYDGHAQAIPAIIPPGSLPPGTATSPAMTPPVPAQPAAAPAPAVPAVPGAVSPLAPAGPAGVYSPQTVPGTPLPPLPGSAAAGFLPPQGTAAMIGTQAGQTARGGV